MSWADFMESKHFGDIYRPYADWIGDFAIKVDNLLGAEPEFGRFVCPLAQRDFVLIYGKSIAMLAISRKSYRHYPLRQTLTWEKFFRVDEAQIRDALHIPEEGAFRVVEKSIDDRLTNDFSFDQPFVAAVPAVFTTFQGSPDDARRSRAIDEAANLFLSEERVFFQEYVEMQKPKDVFLSHKTADKSLVREISDTLAALGYSPWLDEDRMKAGVNLERGLRKGFEESCAAVFFITPHFKDEGYLSTEIDYALSEKRQKGARFSIITLLIPGDDGNIGEVPQMLRPYVWKVAKPVEIIRHIADALPIKPGSFVWRE